MDVIYIEGSDYDFKQFIDAHYAAKDVELTNVEGHNRWVVTREDGTTYIARPLSAKHE